MMVIMVIMKINQLSYKTFNDLPRGGFGDHGYGDLVHHVDHDDSDDGGKSDGYPSLQASSFIQENRVFENTNTNTNMKHQTNPGDQKCKSMRKLAGRTLIDILPPKV